MTRQTSRPYDESQIRSPLFLCPLFASRHQRLQFWSHFELSIVIIAEALDFDISESELRRIWTDIFGENTWVSALIRQLKSDGVPVMLMSNTNEWHWRHALETYPIIAETTPHVLSYEIGVLKPNPLMYHIAADDEAQTERSVLIDDTEDNVEAALFYGIEGILFRNISQLKRDLRALGLPVR